MADNHGLMRGFINLGLLYIEKEEANKALNYLENAFHQASLTGEETELGLIYLNMGVAYKFNGEPVQAEAKARQAETIFKRSSNLMGLALAWINLGGAYIDQRMWEKAKGYLDTALEASRNLKNEYSEIRALMGIVEYELARGNDQQAIIHLNELEFLIQSHNWNVNYLQLKSQLEKYRRSLTES